jgi:lipopolysaccharide export system permease protein
MRLVSRHILRSLAAPFVWGLVALTGLLLLQQLAGLIDKFGGRGLALSVIGEAFLLTLPALVALSLPMSVLVATLYGYSQLAGDLELVAMYANGISVWRMARPALIAAVFITLGNFFLYDQLVPRSNLRYNRLQQAVFRTTPTLTFQPGVMNPLSPSTYVLLARTIDPATSKMTDVTIYDLGSYGTSRIIHAERGTMAQSPSGSDLLLDLTNGVIDEFRLGESGRFQRTAFEHNQWRIRDVVNKLNLATGGNARGDRDMTGCELLDATDVEQWNANEQQRQIEALTRRDLRWLLGLPALPLPSTRLPPTHPKHCGKLYLRFEKWVQDLVIPTAAHAQERPAPVQQPTPPPAGQPQPVTPLQQGSQGQQPGSVPFLVPPAVAQETQSRTAQRTEVEPQTEILRSYQENAMRYQVEYHKKFAIPLASFCFVLLGMALALKYPRSGIGLVIGASMVIFLGFYILLIGGENIAKKGYLSPFVAIQGPLVLFTLLGLLAVRSADREMGTARTAGIFGALMEFFQRFRRKEA